MPDHPVGDREIDLFVFRIGNIAGGPSFFPESADSGVMTRLHGQRMSSVAVRAAAASFYGLFSVNSLYEACL